MSNEAMRLGLVGIATLAMGFALVKWPQKFQEWNVKAMRGNTGFFARGWRSQTTIWTLRAVGVGAAAMGFVALGQCVISLGWV
jgi:hypothetical protein